MQSTITSSPTDIERIASERTVNRAEQAAIEAKMIYLSSRLRILRRVESDLTLRLINAHFTSTTHP